MELNQTLEGDAVSKASDLYIPADANPVSCG